MLASKLVAVIALAAAFTTGCVSKGKYDQAVAQTRTTQAALARTTSTLAQSNAALEKQRAEIVRLEATIAELSSAAHLDRASSEASIAELRTRLGELKAAQSIAEARAALYRDVSLRLKKQIDAGDLAIVIRDGRMVLQLPNDVLFDTARTELKPAGKNALEAVATVIASMSHRQFQVSGHTDNVPIRNERFPSNWELSTGRALRVTHFLIANGVHPAMLSAAGYGDVDPVAPNETDDGRKKNRRTEITLQPQIEELVRVPR